MIATARMEYLAERYPDQERFFKYRPGHLGAVLDKLGKRHEWAEINATDLPFRDGPMSLISKQRASTMKTCTCRMGAGTLRLAMTARTRDTSTITREKTGTPSTTTWRRKGYTDSYARRGNTSRSSSEREVSEASEAFQEQPLQPPLHQR
jgi:hypothetical protein